MSNVLNFPIALSSALSRYPLCSSQACDLSLFSGTVNIPNFRSVFIPFLRRVSQNASDEDRQLVAGQNLWDNVIIKRYFLSSATSIPVSNSPPFSNLLRKRTVRLKPVIFTNTLTRNASISVLKNIHLSA